ncbi:MAG: IMP dehydrogenase [Candidatus Saccharimonadales bacterium]
MEQPLALALTFDDVLLKPRYAGFSRAQIDISTHLTRRIKLQLPLVSSPMDTVTEHKLAIALAEAGGLGFVHRNLSIIDQAKQVKLVKKQALPVGAAIGSSPGYEERVASLVAAGADVLLVDSAHGHAKPVIEAVKFIKANYKVEVIAGNVATADGARALIKAGADGLRVGMGPGAICTTRIISGMGMPQVSAIIDVSRAAAKSGVPVIADGGINYSGDITKALAAGAAVVMMGRLFAATRESSGKIISLKPSQVPKRFKSVINGAKDYEFKQYRGMGSLGAMKEGIKVSSEDEFHGKSYAKDVLIAEGVEGMVPVSGSLDDLVTQLIGGLKSGMYYTGSRTLKDLAQTEFVRITQASLTESHPHDLFVTNTGGNY